MNDSLIDMFLGEDGSKLVCSMLLEDIQSFGSNSTVEHKEYNFNIYSIYINFVDNIVRIEDDLNVREDGTQTLSLYDFVQKLNNV